MSAPDRHAGLEAFFRDRLRAARARPERDALFPRSQLTTKAYALLADLCVEAGAGFVSYTHQDGERFVHVTFLPERIAQFVEEKTKRDAGGKDSQSVLDSVSRESKKTNVQNLPEAARATHNDQGYPDPRAPQAAPLQLAWQEGWAPAAPAAPAADAGLGSGRELVVWGTGAGAGARPSDAGASRKAGAGAVVRPTGLSKDEKDIWIRWQRKALRAFRDCGSVARGIGDRDVDGVKCMMYTRLTDEQRAALQKLCDGFGLGYVTRRERRNTSAGAVVETIDLVTSEGRLIVEFKEETERQKETGPLLVEAPGNRTVPVHQSEREEAMPTAPPSPGAARMEVASPAEETGGQQAWLVERDLTAFRRAPVPDPRSRSLPGPRARAMDDPRAEALPNPRAGDRSDPRGGGFPDPRAGGLPDPRGQPLGTSHRQFAFPPTPPRERCSLDFWHDYKYYVHEQGDETDQAIHHVLREMLVGYAVSVDSQESPRALLPGLLQNPEQVLEVVGRLPQRVISADRTELSLEPLNDREEDKKIMKEFWSVCARSFDGGYIRPRPT